jgi:hypothetical protein
MPDTLDLRFAFLLPVMAEGEEDDEEAEDEEEEESGEEDQEKPPKTAKERDEYIKRLQGEAKKHRLKAKDERAKRLELERKNRAAEEATKPMEDQLKTVQKERDELKATVQSQKVDIAVTKMALDLGVKDVDYFQWKLQKQGHLSVDEEGDLTDEFDEAAKALAKEMTAAGKAGSAGAGSSETEEEESETEPPPKSPTLSGSKKGKKETDREALTRKYPALLSRS